MQEDKALYQLENKKKVHQEHDKIFKKILEDRKEAVAFINKALKLKHEIKENEIEKYNSSYITSKLESQESDIVYKLKDRNIYFLIEHQTKIDYTMPLRILEYEYSIIKSAIDRNRIGQKEYKLPMVISIVLYSGRRKWNGKEYIREIQEKLEGYQELEYARYNLIDVNDFSAEELLKEKTLLTKAMLIEKTRYTENLVENLEKIIKEMNKKEYTEEQRELLSTIIRLVLSNKIGKEVANDLIEKIKEKGGGNDMLAVLEMIEEENKRIFRDGEKSGIRKGKKEGMKETAKNMLKENADTEFIARVTGLTKEEIEKLKVNKNSSLK